MEEEEEELVRIPESQTVRGPDLLKTLPPNTRLFDNLSSSGSYSSELSVPFSDVVFSVEEESKRKAKELYGKNLYTAFSFSPEFIAAMEDIKKEMVLENPDYLKTESLLAENIEDIKSGKVCEPPSPKPEKVMEVKFLEFPHIDYEVEDKEEEEVEDKKKEKESKDKKKKGPKIWLEDDESEFDTMSGYWRMLSVFDEFKISPPWYDAYAEGKEHWLQTKPIPPEVLEFSREKCLTWLDKNFESDQKN